jgi:hypothetical protein
MFSKNMVLEISKQAKASVWRTYFISLSYMQEALNIFLCKLHSSEVTEISSEKSYSHLRRLMCGILTGFCIQT